MSFAGSMASMTARIRIVGGSGIWTMTPSTSGSALSSRTAAVTRASVASPSSSTKSASMPTLAQPRRMRSRYTIEGASRPTIRTRSPGGRPRTAPEAGDVLATAPRSSSAIGAPSSNLARAGGIVSPRPATEVVRAVRRGRRPDVSDSQACSMSSSSSTTRAVIVPSNDGSSTAGRLTRTLAAAPRAAASPRSDATFRSLWALTLLRPASASAASASSTHASTIRSGTSAASRAAARSAVDRLFSLGVGVARLLHRRGEAGIGGGVIVGERQEPVRQGGGRSRRPTTGARRAARISAFLRRARRPSRRGSPRCRRRPTTRCHRPGPAGRTRAPRRSGRASGPGSESRQRHPRGRLYVRGAARRLLADRPAATGMHGPRLAGLGADAVPARPPRCPDAVQRPGRDRRGIFDNSDAPSLSGGVDRLIKTRHRPAT